MPSLLDNLARVKHRIAAAAERAGRATGEVKLIAVTKYVDAAVARELYAAGCHDLGEARPQQLLAKAEALAELPIRWHLIGHLQRNKAKKLLPHTSLIHSGDSLRLLEELDRLAAEQQRIVDVLLEINISCDESKHGFGTGEVEAALPQLAALAGLRIRGLMAMSGLNAAPEQAAAQFEQVRMLRDRLQAAAPPHVQLAELSLGMTDDLEAAVAAGATMVRIGSALFEGLLP